MFSPRISIKTAYIVELYNFLAFFDTACMSIWVKLLHQIVKFGGDLSLIPWPDFRSMSKTSNKIA